MDKKLHLSKTNKILTGVCGGFAEYFNFDPTLIRIIWVLATLIFMFVPVILYVICWAIMPLEK